MNEIDAKLPDQATTVTAFSWVTPTLLDWRHIYPKPPKEDHTSKKPRRTSARAEAKAKSKAKAKAKAKSEPQSPEQKRPRRK